ncbi:hypothetical protein JXA31_00340 [Candidatus Bathyarchaeota archaeon]|nr:hypothetical protein [Candidatus Bathyarchaeota archaeon]
MSEISVQMGRNKSSVQYQVSKLKGKKRRGGELHIEKLSDLELGWLIGCYAGDGSRYFRKKIYSYEVKFALNEKEYSIVEFVETLLSKCGVNSWRCLDKRRVYVKCLSKKLFFFVEKRLKWKGTKKSKSVRLADLPSYSNSFLFGFLCGIIDADGGTKRLYISTASEKMTANLKEICTKLGIAVKVYRYDVFHVYLRKADFRKVCQEYGFSSIKHGDF